MPETHEKSFSNNYAAARPRQSGRFPDGYTDFLGDNSFSLRPGEERFVAYELAAANRRPTRRRRAGMVWTPRGCSVQCAEGKHPSVWGFGQGGQ
jgi:hypothetical protein